MSMVLLVILAAPRAPTAESWERALGESHAPVRFSKQFDPGKQTGFVPVSVQGRKSGFYFLTENYAELTQHCPQLAGMMRLPRW